MGEKVKFYYVFFGKYSPGLELILFFIGVVEKAFDVAISNSGILYSLYFYSIWMLGLYTMM